MRTVFNIYTQKSSNGVCKMTCRLHFGIRWKIRLFWMLYCEINAVSIWIAKWHKRSYFVYPVNGSASSLFTNYVRAQMLCATMFHTHRFFCAGWAFFRLVKCALYEWNSVEHTVGLAHTKKKERALKRICPLTNSVHVASQSRGELVQYIALIRFSV